MHLRLSTWVTSLTAGFAAAARIAAPRVPDVLLASGFACFGAGVYRHFGLDACLMYAGAVLIWTAFGVAAQQGGAK